METPVYMNEEQLSEMLKRAVQTLRNDRTGKRGIPYSKVGRSVRYSLADVVAFMEEKKVRPV